MTLQPATTGLARDALWLNSNVTHFGNRMYGSPVSTQTPASLIIVQIHELEYASQSDATRNHESS